MYASIKCARFEICITKMAGGVGRESKKINKSVLRKQRKYLI